MLYAHVKNGICVAATYNINDYDFNLITFMVLDDFQEGIPVAGLCPTERINLY